MYLAEPAIGPLYPENVQGAEACLVALALFGDGSVTTSGPEAKHFFSIRHQTVWSAATALAQRNELPDLITVADELERHGRLEPVGGLAYLSKFANVAPSVELTERYSEIVREAWMGRELRRVASEVPFQLDNGAGILEVADRLRAFVDRMETVSEATAVTLDLAVAEERSRIVADIERVEAGEVPEAGLPTGLGLEDGIVPGGIPRDRLTLILGETGTYKTAVKQVISDSIAASGKYVLDFTLEDSAELTAQRFLARHTGIPYGRIAARELSRAEIRLIDVLQPAAREVASRTIVVGNVPATIEEAVRLSRYWTRKVPLAAVFVDYIQLIETNKRDNEAQAVGEICKKAQRAAHRDKLAWVLVSQMNRRYADREDKRPQLTDLYGSSVIAQTCKLAIGIYRPAMYEPEPAESSQWRRWYANAPNARVKYQGALELIVRKNVVGEIGVMHPVVVDRPTGRIEQVTL
jgi:replicative DNA helicase